MTIIKAIWDTIIEALFPMSEVEKRLFSYSPQEAFHSLPRAPAFSDLTVNLNNPYISFENMHSIFAYKDPMVTKLVWNVKYKRSKRAVSIAGYALHETLHALVQSHDLNHPIIIPMPITPRRRRERGYNQCDLLIDEIARLDTSHVFTVNKNLLNRVHHVSRQTLKGRDDRLESAKGIFEVDSAIFDDIAKDNIANKINPPSSTDLSNISIIVIDDVITTGSTMNEALKTLQKAGFKNVFGLSVAH